MPELPEVETVRRNLEATVLGRTIDQVRLSGKKLRSAVSPRIRTALRERRVESVARHGKYLLLRLDAGTSLISHLGMSGRWLFFAERSGPRHAARAREDPLSGRRRAVVPGPASLRALKLVPTARLREDPALAGLGPDPIATPPSGASLEAVARRATIAVKSFLLDQKRLAGVGNIYASEILHRAGVDPRRAAGKLRRHEWDAVARETVQVLNEAIERMGTTFSAYRTLWNEPGSYGEQLLVYDREGRPVQILRAGHPPDRPGTAQHLLLSPLSARLGALFAAAFSILHCRGPLWRLSYPARSNDHDSPAFAPRAGSLTLRGGSVPFSTLGLPPVLVKGVRAAGFVEPTPLQRKAIPIILKGNDLIGAAQSGTGKTASYLLPTLTPPVGGAAAAARAGAGAQPRAGLPGRDRRARLRSFHRPARVRRVRGRPARQPGTPGA